MPTNINKSGWNYKKENNFSQEPLLLRERNFSAAGLYGMNNNVESSVFPIINNERLINYSFGGNNSNQENKITLNISGERMQINESLLNKYPDTLLGSKESRLPFYDSKRDEYFYDRSSNAFEGILFFYQSNGRVVVPSFVHVEIFYEELKYFRLVNYLTDDPKCDESILFVAFTDLHLSIEEEFKTDKKELRKRLFALKKKYKRINFFGDDEEDDSTLPKNKYQQSLYLLLERPNRSSAGKFVAFFFLFFVIVSITAMCMETVIITDFKTDAKLKSAIDYLFIDENEQQSLENNKRIFFLIELACNFVFTAEVVLRMIATDKKIMFLKKFSNIVDIVSIIPFWITFLLQLILSIGYLNFNEKSVFTRLGNFYVLRILRLTRVLRILKLSRHVKALNIIGKIFVECIYEITLLMSFFAMNIVVFSSLMYYIEYQAMGSESPFISIPDTFWWAVISFTTVGYGDLIPVSPYGKASCCVFILFGLLIAVLPSPILSIKFERLYKQLSIVNTIRKKKNEK